MKQVPETKLKEALFEIHQDNIDAKVRGFNKLNDSLYVTRRVFSGLVGIPIGKEDLIDQNFVTTLTRAVHIPQVSTDALSWLFKLINSSDDVKPLLLHSDPSLNKFAKILSQDDYSKSKDWILASHILLHLDKDAVVLKDSPEFGEGIRRMYSSGHPLAISLASDLISLVPTIKNVDPSTVTALQHNVSPLSHHINDLGLVNIPQLKKSPFTVSPNPRASEYSTIAFALFAALWGKFRWYFGLKLSPAYRTLIKGQDPVLARSLTKHFLRQRSVGSVVLYLLGMDLISSYLLKHASGKKLGFNSNSPIQIPDNNYQLPLLTIYPFIQTTLFTMSTIYAIQRQRYVVLPLILAGVFYNYEAFQSRELNQVLDPIAHEYDRFVSNYGIGSLRNKLREDLV